MAGWRRINASARWHFWRPYAENELLLAPVCKREMFLKRGTSLRTKDELPEGAKLCRGCSGSPELRFIAA